MKKIRLYIVLLLAIVKVHAQPGTSPEDIIKEKLRRFCELMPREEIYVHSDRAEYIAGEDLWFNIYLIDRQKNTVTDHSSIAYVDLINPDNRKVISKRIRLDKGLGPGHILLPDTLSSGRYTIRAYTNWMRNFMPENCFVREILIYNALNDRKYKGKSSYTDSGLREAEENKTDWESDPGMEIIIGREKSGRKEITLITDDSFRAGNNYKCYLLVQTNGVVNTVKTVNLKSETVKINVPEEIFIPGINQIVIFSSELEPLYERFVFTPFKQEEVLKIISADTFKTREKAAIVFSDDFRVTDTPAATFASLSVTPGTGRSRGGDITDYMVFGSEFGPLPESFLNRRIVEISVDSVDRFLRNAKSNWIDWSCLMSDKLPELKYKVEKDGHFITGQLVQKITQEPLTGKYMFLSLPGKTATFQYSMTDSTGSFSFSLAINDKVKDLIVQPEEPDLKSSVKIGTPLDRDLFKNDVKADTSVFEVPEYISKWGVNYQIGKVYGISNSSDPPAMESMVPVYKRFYGKPDIELKMKDYISLPLMEEVFFELTPGVQLKRKGNIYGMIIEDPVTRLVHKKPPVLFMDGIVVKDPAVIAGLDPETVERIDVIKDLYLVGDYIFFGIVNVITIAGDFSGISLPDDAIRFKYTVAESVPLFNSPEYSDEKLRNSRIPDFRNTLYWNPSVNLSSGRNSVINFWTSDQTGTYEINLQGVNYEGKPVSFRKQIRVN